VRSIYRSTQAKRSRVSPRLADTDETKRNLRADLSERSGEPIYKSRPRVSVTTHSGIVSFYFAR